MAAPNIVGVTTIYGKSSGLALTTSNQTLVSNSAGSGKVFKVNTVMISNVDGANDATVTAQVYKASTGTAYKLAHVVSVEAASTLVLMSKDNSIYLEEGDYIQALASATGDLHAVCSWEEIND